ncbi:ferredoxin-NADP reductase [Nitrobacteraceae bacterium AZCC 2161]
MSDGREISVRVSDITVVAKDIKRFRLQPISGALPLFSAGSHIVVSIFADDRRIRNPYSLTSVGDPSGYDISVLKTANSRGGSVFMHERVTKGTELVISQPVNLFPINLSGRKHILLAGGIGITPFITMAHQLASFNQPFQLHYGSRSKERGAYAESLKEAFPDRVFLYRDDEGTFIPIDALLQNQPLGTHLYVCGPEGMINAFLKAGLAAGWPKESLHAERFIAPSSGKPFSVKLVRSGRTIKVDEHQSILEAVEDAGVKAPYLCRGGACGQCETDVVSCDGELIHNDNYLDPDVRKSGSKIMICVSRLNGFELALNL